MGDNTSTTQQTISRFSSDSRPTDYVGVAAEVTIDIKETRARVHDGTTKGGIPLARLDEIYSKEEIASLLGSYILKTEQYSNDKIDSMLRDFYRKSEADTKMRDMVEPQRAKITYIEHTLLSKANKPYVDERIRTYSTENIEPVYARRVSTYNKTEIDNLLATKTNDLSREEIDKIKANIASNDASLDTRQEIVDAVKTNKTNIDSLNTLVTDGADLEKIKETVAFIKANKPVLDALTLDAIAETATKKHLTTELRDKLQELYTKGQLDIKFDNIDVKLGKTVSKTELGDRLNALISTIGNEYASKNDVYTKPQVNAKLDSLTTNNIKDGTDRRFITDAEYNKLNSMYNRQELDELLKEAFLITPTILGNNKLTINTVRDIVTNNNLKNRFIVYNGHTTISGGDIRNVWYVDSQQQTFEMSTNGDGGNHLTGCTYKIIRNNVDFIQTNFLNKAVKVIRLDSAVDGEVLALELADEKRGIETDGLVIKDNVTGNLLLAFRGVYDTNLGVDVTTRDEWYWLGEEGKVTKTPGDNIKQLIAKPLTSTNNSKIYINIGQPIIIGSSELGGLRFEDVVKDNDIDQSKGLVKDYNTRLWGIDKNYIDNSIRDIIREVMPDFPTNGNTNTVFSAILRSKIDVILSESNIPVTDILKIPPTTTGDKKGLKDSTGYFNSGLNTTVNGVSKLFKESVDIMDNETIGNTVAKDTVFVCKGMVHYREDVDNLDTLSVVGNFIGNNSLFYNREFSLIVEGVRYKISVCNKVGTNPNSNLIVYLKDGTEIDEFDHPLSNEKQDTTLVTGITRKTTVGFIFLAHALPSTGKFTNKQLNTFIYSYLKHTQNR